MSEEKAKRSEGRLSTQANTLVDFCRKLETLRQRFAETLVVLGGPEAAKALSDHGREENKRALEAQPEAILSTIDWAISAFDEELTLLTEILGQFREAI